MLRGPLGRIVANADSINAAYDGPIAAFYEEVTGQLAAEMAQGSVLGVLCDGDPFFYGSFMHLWRRLSPRFATEIVPGIPAMAGVWTAAGAPITWGDDVLTVLPATLPQAELARRAADTDALVVMKIGRNLAKLKTALTTAGRIGDAWLVEHGTMPAERVRRLDEVGGTVPYFSIVLVHGRGRRP